MREDPLPPPPPGRRALYLTGPAEYLEDAVAALPREVNGRPLERFGAG